jgi:hypothetical protein
MPYVPDWEPIAGALQRVVATGLTADEAKRQLCAAIADQKIGLQIVLAGNPSRRAAEQAVSGSLFDIPPRLAPNDIDWTRSRPMTDWSPVRPRPGQPVTLQLARIQDLLDRKIAVIRLRTADVAAIFEAPPRSVGAGLPPTRVTPKEAAGAKRHAVSEAVAALWPDGIPASLTRKERNAQIITWARDQKRSVPGERTIQRALKESDS